MRLANPKNPPEIVAAVNKFILDNPMKHLPDFKKYEPKNWLWRVEELLKTAAKTTGRPDPRGFENLQKSVKSSLRNLPKVNGGEFAECIAEDIEDLEAAIDQLFDICHNILHKVRKKLPMQQYILQNISTETVRNRCSPHAEWPDMLEDLEDSVHIIHQGFALLKSECIGQVVDNYHGADLQMLTNAENFFAKLNELINEDDEEAEQAEAEMEYLKNEFKEAWIENCVETVTRISRQAKTKEFKTFELDNQFDFDLIKPEWKEHGISLHDFTEMSEKANAILKRKGITMIPVIVDAGNYLRWLSANKKTNTDRSRAEYVGQLK